MERVGPAFHRLVRGLLQRVYGFDRWHVGHAGEAYGVDIVRYLNARPEEDRQAVAEIGCGLGDILRRLRFHTRLGLDRDPGAVAAARMLALFQRGADLRFQVFEFPEARLPGDYNAIIMVNWIHEIEPERLRQAVHACFANHLRDGGCLILDTVQDSAYTYNHDVRKVVASGAVVDRLGQYPRGREVWVVRRPLVKQG